MLKTAVVLSLNIASILAVVTTLYESPVTYVEWKIEKFFDLPKEREYFISSPQFSLSNSKWDLKIYPNGEPTYDSDDFLSLFLRNRGCNLEYHVNYHLGFKTIDGFEIIKYRFESIFNKSVCSYGCVKCFNRSKLLRLKNSGLNVDTLTVFCKAEILNEIKVTPEITSSTGIVQLTDDLKDLYTSKRFTDITLTVKNREFQAHRNILSSRLTVFGSMAENITDKVEITDCDPDSFEEFLIFVYSGKLNNVPTKKAMSLYLTAQKYNLSELKSECIRSLVEQDIMNVESFYDILRFAIIHSHDELLMYATEAFIFNAKNILLNENWENFLTEYPLQGRQLFLRYVEKKN